MAFKTPEGGGTFRGFLSMMMQATDPSIRIESIQHVERLCVLRMEVVWLADCVPVHQFLNSLSRDGTLRLNPRSR